MLNTNLFNLRDILIIGVFAILAHALTAKMLRAIDNVPQE
jgi:hypothetical protein